MSDGSDRSLKLDESAAKMVQRALKDQGLAEQIDMTRQNYEIVEIYKAMLASNEWIGQAEGIYEKLEVSARIAKVSELLKRMATVYKIGFEAGRVYEREHEESPTVALVSH